MANQKDGFTDLTDYLNEEIDDDEVDTVIGIDDEDITLGYDNSDDEDLDDDE